MDAKENALRIIRFDHPETVASWPPIHMIRYLGCNHEAFDGSGGDDAPLGSRWVDVWGTEWHKEQEGVMGFPRGNPLDAPGKLSSYRWPDPQDERLVAMIYERAKAFPGGDRMLTGFHRDTLWEKAYMLVGMENMMAYFHTEPGFCREVLHRIMDFQIGMARHYLSLGVELVMMGDDLGTQVGALLGPRVVDEFLRPEYERLFALYRERGILIHFHSCGNLDSVLDMFLELGVNVLNPLQASANDLQEVRRRTQGRMALQGGVSSALVMEGPVERIVADVRRKLWLLGRHGGYFCMQDQGLPFPQQHLDALSRAIATYGRYPLEDPGATAWSDRRGS
jgi:uroporphyrinogen decarboxylase